MTWSRPSRPSAARTTAWADDLTCSPTSRPGPLWPNRSIPSTPSVGPAAALRSRRRSSAATGRSRVGRTSRTGGGPTFRVGRSPILRRLPGRTTSTRLRCSRCRTAAGTSVREPPVKPMFSLNVRCASNSATNALVNPRLFMTGPCGTGSTLSSSRSRSTLIQPIARSRSDLWRARCLETARRVREAARGDGSVERPKPRLGPTSPTCETASLSGSPLSHRPLQYPVLGRASPSSHPKSQEHLS